jgi:hypothetical protein
MLIGGIIVGCQKDPETVFNQDAPSVEAGTSQTIQMPANSFTLNGSATTQNGVIKAYLWSLVSGPNVPVITSPGSKTTTVTGFISGNYLFQLMATDDAGLTGVDTTSVLVKPSPIQTLTLQPANNTEAHFAVLGGISQTDPAAPELVAAAWTSGGDSYNFRGALKFDLSSIPASATILSAKLTLYSNPTPLNGDHVNANSGSNNAMYIRRLLSAWTPSTITWYNQPPQSLVDQVLIPHTTVSLLDLTDIDVKSMVSAMVLSGNYGFMLGLQNETPYNSRIFCSSRYANSAKYPKLVVAYQ